MEIKSTKRPANITKPETPGLLIGVDNPPPALSQIARDRFGLAQDPNYMLIGIHGRTLAQAQAMRQKKMDDAIAKSGLALTKLISKSLAQASGSDMAKHGVNLFWIGVNCLKLYDKWESATEYSPALMVETASTAYDALDWSSDVTGLGASFFQNDGIKSGVSAIFEISDALAERDQTVKMGHWSDIQIPGDAGKIVSAVAPLIDAAIDPGPTYSSFSLKPDAKFVV